MRTSVPASRSTSPPETIAILPTAVNRERFNVGIGNVQVRTVAMLVRETLPFPVEIIMAPDDPDRRDYQVDFGKLTDHTGFTPATTVEDGVFEIYNALKYGELENTPQCSTVGWYRNILAAKKLLEEVELDGRVL